MDGNIDDFAEQSEGVLVSIKDIMEKSTLKPEISQAPFTKSDFISLETISSTSPTVKNSSTKRLFEESIAPNPAISKVELITTSTTNARSLEPVVEAASKIESEELLESLILQIEETEEMLELVSLAKEKFKSFISRVEHFLRCLQEISKHSDAKNGGKNTYLKSIYEKKLVESASNLLDKIHKSIKDLEVDYVSLKEHNKKATEIFEQFTEFLRIPDPCMGGTGKKVEDPKEIVAHLAEELYSLKLNPLSEIEKVFHVKTDIDMLYDLCRRFSNIEDQA